MSKLCDTQDTLDKYDRIVKKTLDRFIPFKVDWEITYRCNLRCSHCYQTEPRKEGELETKRIFSVLEELASLSCLYITFTGGEIFLREDFFDIAHYARKREFALRFFTNGTLIDVEVADKIKELNPLSVEISLYGMDSTVHEGITGISGSYDKTIRAFKLLKERNINTIVKCTFIKENASQFDKLKEFAQSMGLAFNFSFTIIPKVDGSRDILRHRLSEAELKELFGSREYLIKGIAKGGVHSYEPLCSAGINSLYISPYGEVFPCVVLRENCGNVKDLSLGDIWKAHLFKKIRDIKFEDLNKCSRCSLSYYCDRCAGLAWMEAGDLLGLSPNDCVLARVREWAIEKREVRDEGRKEERILQQA